MEFLHRKPLRIVVTGVAAADLVLLQQQNIKYPETLPIICLTQYIYIILCLKLMFYFINVNAKNVLEPIILNLVSR
jgi:hypothetical protein